MILIMILLQLLWPFKLDQGQPTLSAQLLYQELGMVSTPTKPLLELDSNNKVWFKVYVDLLWTQQISDFATAPI